MCNIKRFLKLENMNIVKHPKNGTFIQCLKILTTKSNFLASHLLKLQHMQAVAEAVHGGQRCGFQQQQVLVQGRRTLRGWQALNALNQISVLALGLTHHLKTEKQF